MITQELLARAAAQIIGANGAATDGVELERQWTDGGRCKFTVKNTSSQDVALREVTVFQLAMPLAASTEIYGEGYNMLSQYKGTLQSFENVAGQSDYKHYKLPQKAGFNTAYNLLMLFPEAGEHILLGFASCKRFSNELRFNLQTLEIAIDCEGQTLKAGATWELEEFIVLNGEREALLAEFAAAIGGNHQALSYPEMPAGWCSWYCYGPSLTEQDVYDNLAAIAKDGYPGLKFIQIDDGYQNKQGDWLIPHPNFPNGVKELCLAIKDRGFEPAIWVAPFCAEKDSELFKNHPDWFIKDEAGAPLSSGDVTFGGWRCAPWYMLDGTHPGAREYLREVFHVMRHEWQCKYYKLDANMWGAMPFGQRHDPQATRVEAYRRGMEALIAGAGPDSFILGCNAPMWPSIGVVHGMRTTGDIYRRWSNFASMAEQCFYRNWQNNNLWMNDPDCLVQDNLQINTIGPDGKPTKALSKITENEFSFHAAHILASGGMMLGSDRMPELSERGKNVLRRLLPPLGRAAVFDDRQFRLGRINFQNGEIVCLFNWGNTEARLTPKLSHNCVRDFWTDKQLDVAKIKNEGIMLPARSARVLRCVAD